MALSKLAVRRLTKLADFMDALPRKANKHFYMNTFYRHDGGHPIDVSPAVALRKLDCGTQACALGWAAAIPAFKKAGLELHDSWVSLKGVYVGEEAMAEEFFACDCYRELFHSKNADITTPKEWSKRCRKFIKDNA